MLDQFINFLKFEKRYSPHTVAAYSTDLEQFQAYIFKIFEVSDMLTANFNMVRSWLISLNEQHLATKSLHRKIASVRGYYKFLIKNKLIVVDPTVKIKVPKLQKKLPIFAASNDMNVLLDTVSIAESNEFAAVRDKLIMELFYGTGMRLAELINLSSSDVDINAHRIKVTGKGNKQRLIPLHSELMLLIANYQSVKSLHQMDNISDAFIVTDKGLKCYPIFIYRIVKKNLSTIKNLEKTSPHVLRHTFATHLLDQGADLNAIKELLGHSSLVATQVYTHNTPSRLKAIYDQAHPKGNKNN